MEATAWREVPKAKRLLLLLLLLAKGSKLLRLLRLLAERKSRRLLLLLRLLRLLGCGRVCRCCRLLLGNLLQVLLVGCGIKAGRCTHHSLPRQGSLQGRLPPRRLAPLLLCLTLRTLLWGQLLLLLVAQRDEVGDVDEAVLQLLRELRHVGLGRRQRTLLWLLRLALRLAKLVGRGEVVEELLELQSACCDRAFRRAGSQRTSGRLDRCLWPT
jgi:hypothetical protein